MSPADRCGARIRFSTYKNQNGFEATCGSRDSSVVRNGFRSILSAQGIVRTPKLGIMESQLMNPTSPAPEPELHLLITDKQFEEPLYRSLFRGLDEFFFPKKLPPLKLESKPAPVKDIWGFYNYKKNGALGSTGVHILLAGLLV